MFAEPARTPYDVNFAIAGVPVRIHPFFWLIALVLGAGGDPEPKFVLIWTLSVLVSILVHEFGHVLAFHRFGLPAHVVLYAFGGLAVPESRSGFSSHGRGIRSPRDQIVVALAGPFAGFLFAALIVALMWATGYAVGFSLMGFTFFDLPGKRLPSSEALILVLCLLEINILWGLLNLLPIYPLDGGHVFRSLLLMFNPHDGLRQSLVLSMFTAGCIALLAILKYQSIYMALMFGYLAFQSFQWLDYRGGGGRW